VGAKQNRIVAGSHEESVLHVTCGVLRREVQGLEHVVVILDFRAFSDVVAEFAENLDDFLAGDGNRMA